MPQRKSASVSECALILPGVPRINTLICYDWRMKRFVFITISFVLVVFFYVIIVIFPNQSQKNKYEDCVKHSITEEQAQKYNYAGNIRNDKTSPKTCYDGRETITESKGNTLLP